MPTDIQKVRRKVDDELQNVSEVGRASGAAAPAVTYFLEPSCATTNIISPADAQLTGFHSPLPFGEKLIATACMHQALFIHHRPLTTDQYSLTGTSHQSLAQLAPSRPV